MFDKIEIDNKKVDIYFDIDNFKLKINRYDWTFMEVNLNKEFIVIKNFVLFIKYSGNFNNYSTEYDVLFYIQSDYEKFEPLNLSNVLIRSNEISYLLYSQKSKKQKYFIETDKCKFEVAFNRNNKMQKWYYNDIRGCGNVEIKLTKCNDWETYRDIINAVINSISICSLYRRNNNFEILLSNIRKKNIGKIVFPMKLEMENIGINLGKLDIIKKDVKKIIVELIKHPFLSQHVIPQYSNYHTQLDFYKLYACFEYEYNMIDKVKLYNAMQKKENTKISNMKKNIIDTLEKNNVEITYHYLNSLHNYNPMEGHKQKLKNAVEYSKKFLEQRYSDINFIENEKDFINYIYETRIKVIHEPDDNIKIENANYIDVFNEIVYSLFLKRCKITNSRIDEICKEIFIPYI